jgi:hypothetical protein
VAGVRASFATVEQATTPYALEALKASAALRNRADPPLTLGEINAAVAVCHAVDALVGAVESAGAAGTTPDAFIAASASLIAPTGLSEDHVRTMFSARELRQTVTEATARVNAGQSTASQEAEAIPADERLGVSVDSLKRYVQKPGRWGEHRAAWKRLAVQRMNNEIGRRLEEVAEADQGTALIGPVVRARVDARLQETPHPSEEQIVRSVGHMNNPGEPDYGENIWITYQRLFPAPLAPPPHTPAPSP